ncbi:cytochrome C oxidase subunit IV family protein [Snuella sedimenti]|uniref:cytochrome C oxidase subunit IV family protein n=1 Tax=Snuella sedimenti TaxID=2798802 RepID=UPI0037431167
MQKTVTTTWIILIILTISSALIFKLDGSYVTTVILILSALKFLGISFQFMDMNKAHIAWKTIIISFITVFVMGLLLIVA